MIAIINDNNRTNNVEEFVEGAIIKIPPMRKGVIDSVKNLIPGMRLEVSILKDISEKGESSGEGILEYQLCYLDLSRDGKKVLRYRPKEVYRIMEDSPEYKEKRERYKQLMRGGKTII